MIDEGAVRVRLRVRGGTVAAVTVDSSRPVLAAAVFRGRPAADVPHRLPILYSLCGTAQGVAALEAVEAALAIAAAPAQRTARRLLLAAEAARENGGRLLLDTADALGEPLPAEAVVAVRRPLAALSAALYPDGDGTRLGGGRLAPDAAALEAAIDAFDDAVIRWIFGPGLVRWDDSMDTEALGDWARGTATGPARWIRRLADGPAGGFGAAPFHPLTAADLPRVADHLAAADADAYVAAPHVAGTRRETGPLVRRRCVPLVADANRCCGTGLLTRWAARLADVAAGAGDLRALLEGLVPDPGDAAPARRSGAGVGVVEAARGLLVHRAEVVDDTVTGYRVLAPTEWNFHPEGPLATGLRGVAAGPDLIRRAGQLARAIDPCVAHEVTVDA